MITSQLIGQVTESLIPYLMFRSRVTKVSKEGKKIVVKSADLSDSVERQSMQELYPVSGGGKLTLRCEFKGELQTKNDLLLSKSLIKGMENRFSNVFFACCAL